ncbi:hypothetical protein [Paraburkholderia fungorum]|uniref:hypothetical protein n=1 Tax=Paraburkholderia fungorum TaxID=134537 RepID=UPI0004806AE3|nr:hypothetical protein [Paraburkholderia fungorum]KFX67272.1 membrane protein [Burkholderia sp. K24]MBB5539776.1 hypothetical protein [Paraburkholderia fungorum]PNE53199.1 hypothetical protein A8H39_31740 [Paraburkholderia fungorum]USX04929.1 hypothetical protein NHH62_17645 [Paraburkholderia fungorum]
MDLRSAVLVLSSALLALSSFFYGWKFVRKRNYLLGLEMWIVGISSTNAIGFFVTGNAVSYEISHFFDAFSRGFGMPIIAVAGLMAITHGYTPSVRQDVSVFVASFALTFVLVGADFIARILPYYYLTMWILLSIYLLYFIKRLLEIGEMLRALFAGVALVTSLGIATIYDFYKIPGEETNVFFNFYTLALCSWAYFMPAIYYGYCALERAKNGRVVLNSPTAYGN